MKRSVLTPSLYNPTPNPNPDPNPNGYQVADDVDDPTMDWAAYTDSFTKEMHVRPTIQAHPDPLTLTLTLTPTLTP